ncbi:type I-E CRISPR-associated protein Cas5/CasD [Rubellimicrobium roseum]|uniref:Type I-E CRISPR-associated protein Cas5/CasD n=1 Tax=Rubellimicrobium roseum TaxID=687525 RepID=A0A5C4NDN1_9RHOB|nr:type I-E CRISPR-associated protein Cas5/CasD [Rubellimicrobium roseum]TNC72035.1 type I-E CRISPR-associated protein Cas5/CasD [Rubellimicrobium roseum]
MPEHLVFTLAASLAAMGELAGHERRGTLLWPGRSAVLGLVAAAQGIRREDRAGLAALEPLRVAVGVWDEGVPLRDYHTVETVPTAAAKRPDSRPEALRRAGQGTNTTITLRDYRVGVLYGVVLWGQPLAPLADALRQPAFALYLGRKSCPLAVPPSPRIVEAEGAVEALSNLQLPPFREGRRAPVLRLVASDEPLGANERREQRQDAVLDRGTWHFASRAVHVMHIGDRA